MRHAAAEQQDLVMPQNNEENGSERPRAAFVGVGLALGVGVGVALGVALENIAVGIAVGAGVGLVFAIALSAKGSP
jgi:hypothetical protein